MGRLLIVVCGLLWVSRVVWLVPYQYCSYLTVRFHTIYSIYFIRANVPETKGLSLEEIEHQFKALQKQNKRKRLLRDDEGFNTNLDRLLVSKRDETVEQEAV